MCVYVCVCECVHIYACMYIYKYLHSEAAILLTVSAHIDPFQVLMYIEQTSHFKPQQVNFLSQSRQALSLSAHLPWKENPPWLWGNFPVWNVFMRRSALLRDDNTVLFCSGSASWGKISYKHFKGYQPPFNTHAVYLFHSLSREMIICQ